MRSAPKQGEPVGLDSSFPRTSLRRKLWFRSHRYRNRPDSGCWFYASAPAVPDQRGRFDLADPRGTCYLASTELAAARERLGRAGSIVDAEEVKGVVVTQVRFDAHSMANLRHPDAALAGVTRELSTSTQYQLAQAWAAAFDVLGFAGIAYQPRFSPDDTHAVAAFGPSGTPEPLPDTDSTRQLADVLKDHGYQILEAPPTRSLGSLLE